METNCIIWIGARHGKGYGHTRRNGLVRKAHRIVWEKMYGPISEGAMILHNCHNPSCVNPAHLRLGDNAENMKDRTEIGRMHTQKLDGWGACSVIADLLMNVRPSVTSNRLGISRQECSNIRYGRRWRWLFDGERV